MKGCLSFIIKTFIAVLIFFVLKYLGIIEFIQEKITEHSIISKEQQLQKASDFLDLSQIDDEYTVDKTLKILKNRVLLVQHNSSGQKMIMIEPKNENFLTKDDINSDEIQGKINKLAKKYKNKFLRTDNIEVVKQDSFFALEQKIPYVKINVEISNLPVKDFEGILGLAELKTGKNIIIIAINQKDKYSQIITEAFFKKVKNAK